MDSADKQRNVGSGMLDTTASPTPIDKPYVPRSLTLRPSFPNPTPLAP